MVDSLVGATRENTAFGVRSVKENQSNFIPPTNNKSGIFTSGEAARENTAFGVN